MRNTIEQVLMMVPVKELVDNQLVGEVGLPISGDRLAEARKYGNIYPYTTFRRDVNARRMYARIRGDY